MAASSPIPSVATRAARFPRFRFVAIVRDAGDRFGAFVGFVAFVAKTRDRNRTRSRSDTAQDSVDFRRGSVTTKTAPFGLLSSMVTRPSCPSTSRFTIERPRPVPPTWRVELEST